MQKTFVKSFFTIKECKSIVEKNFKFEDLVMRGSMEKAKNAAKIELKKAEKKMDPLAENGFLLEITKQSDNVVIGYAVMKEAVNKEWCEAKSNETIRITLTAKEVTTSLSLAEV